MRMLLAGAITLALTGQIRPLLERCDVELASPWRLELPARLSEVSGLALSSSGSLLAHNDERGVVFVIDTATGRVTAEFSMGPSLPADDFEGIEEAAGRLFLVTSEGRLYETRVRADGARVQFERLDTDLGRLCEVEGLAVEPAADVLLLACKQPRDRELEGRVALFRWAVERKAPASPERIVFEERALRVPGRGNRFRPSGVARDPGTGHYILISAQDGGIAEVTAQGHVVAVARLRGHRQPEGVAVSADGRLWIADEGGNGRATLSMYACR